MTSASVATTDLKTNVKKTTSEVTKISCFISYGLTLVVRHELMQTEFDRARPVVVGPAARYTNLGSTSVILVANQKKRHTVNKTQQNKLSKYRKS